MMRTLEGKLIVLAVTGSIAAVEVVRLVHALRRRGAAVQGVMSPAALGIIHPDALVCATGRPVVTKCTGMVEHVAYCGDRGSADLLLVCPCTANTIGKMAAGIDDTAVTTFAAAAIGSGLPVIVVPAMHESMYRHPAVGENLDRLKGWGITVVDPRIEEGKAKVAGMDKIILSCERQLMGRSLEGKRVLITSGPCREPVDDIRVLTTRSGGTMGRELALQAFRLGAGVTVVHGDRFPCVRNVHAGTAEEMRTAVLDCLGREGADFYVSAAAISDFAPRRIEGKIPAGSPVTLNLVPLPNLIRQVAGSGPVVVAFKLGSDAEDRAGELLSAGASLVVCNGPDAMGTDCGRFVLVTRGGRIEINGTKEEVAAAVWHAMVPSQANDRVKSGS